MSTSNNSVFSSLEETEQSVIQAIRTSGLRKASETSIIDNLLNTRRERRRIFSDLMNVVETIRSQKGDLEKQLETARLDIHHREKRYNTQLEENQQRLLREHEITIFAMKKKFDSKLKELAAKLDAVTTTAANKEEIKVQERAANLTSIELNKQRELYENKLLRYKHALRDIYDREKQMENIIKINRDTNNSNENELKNIRLLLNDKINENNNLISNNRQLETNNINLKTALEEEKVTNSTLLMEKSSLNDQMNYYTRQIEERHALELETVDEKVRNAIDKKDEVIHNLQNMIQNLHKDQQELKMSLQSVFQMS
jgi:hypothetical protein